MSDDGDDAPWAGHSGWEAAKALWRNRTRLPSITWVPFGVPWADRLRGEPFFRRWQLQYALLRLVGGSGRVTIAGPAERRVRIKTGDLVIVCMPCLPHHRELVDACRQVGADLVVDVTADVLGMVGDPPLAADIAALEGNTPESNAFWAQVSPRMVLRDALVAASCVTTSWEHLVEPLALLSNRPVLRLPDWHVEDEVPFLAAIARLRETIDSGRSR